MRGEAVGTADTFIPSRLAHSRSRRHSITQHNRAQPFWAVPGEALTGYRTWSPATQR